MDLILQLPNVDKRTDGEKEMLDQLDTLSGSLEVSSSSYDNLSLNAAINEIIVPYEEVLESSRLKQILSLLQDLAIMWIIVSMSQLFMKKVNLPIVHQPA